MWGIYFFKILPGGSGWERLVQTTGFRRFGFGGLRGFEISCWGLRLLRLRVPGLDVFVRSCRVWTRLDLNLKADGLELKVCSFP